MLRQLVALASLGLLVMTGEVLGKDVKNDLDRLQGAWDIIEVVISGTQIDPDQVKGGQVSVKGEVMTMREGENDKEPRQFQIKLSPREAPKAIEMTALNREYQGSVNHAIYALDKDTLKLCAPNSTNEDKRPTEFKSEQASGVILMTLKRVKP